MSLFDDKEERRILSVQEQADKHKSKLELREALKNKEILGSTKAKKARRLQGDRCTGFVHRLVSSQTARSSIAHLVIDRKKETEKDAIEFHLRDFYK